jgi:hypothetical protein
MRVSWLLTMVRTLSPAPSEASVTAQQAQELDRTLSPVGAERAGNASGTIPAWGGGGMPPNLAAEAPLFTIDAAHAAQYREELPEGGLALKIPLIVHTGPNTSAKSGCSCSIWEKRCMSGPSQSSRIVGIRS